MKHWKRWICILLIICGAIGIGVVLNEIWIKLEYAAYPKEYDEYVEQYATEYQIPREIVWAIIKVESDFDPRARSSVGAMGLMQMMPSTFDWLTSDEHLGEHLPANSLYTPEVSIRYGAYYLHYLYEKFENWETVFAAYNGGEGNVSKWLADPQYGDGSGGLTKIPFDETRSYVKKVNEARDMYKKIYFDEKEGTPS